LIVSGVRVRGYLLFTGRNFHSWQPSEAGTRAFVRRDECGDSGKEKTASVFKELRVRSKTLFSEEDDDSHLPVSRLVKASNQKENRVRFSERGGEEASHRIERAVNTPWNACPGRPEENRREEELNVEGSLAGTTQGGGILRKGGKDPDH